jgi:hypothetical protein
MSHGTSALTKALGYLCILIVGKSSMPAFARACVEKTRQFAGELTMNAASAGMAREKISLLASLDKLAASIKPDSMWTFHKVDCGRCEGVIMPRTVDSNTVVVTATTDPDIKVGDVITIDGNPPNCEPGALQMIIAPAMGETV